MPASLMVRVKRLIRAMLPSYPTAPHCERIRLRRHQHLKSSHQKMLSLSQIGYLGVALARAIILPRKQRTANDVGRFGKTERPIARRSSDQ